MKKTAYLIGLLILVLTSCNGNSKNQPASLPLQANGKDTTITFDIFEGTLPSGWSQETGRWITFKDQDNGTLKMEKNDGSTFNITVLTGLHYKNLELEVRVKALTGEEDQGGGLVWRYVDKDNYYIVRANPLENNIRFYKVVNGKRKQLESADIEMRTGDWYALKVIAKGNFFECYYNGKKVFQSSDETFPDPGLVGFWSKADAVSLFDDLKLETLK
jgi:hypothetical protein